MGLLFYAVFGGVTLAVSYAVSRLIFDLLLRGFAPFLSSRPWVVAKMMEDLKQEPIRPDAVIYSLSCGKSGFLHEIGKLYPQARLIGVEHDIFPYLLGKIQLMLRRSKIKIKYVKKLYNLEVKDADLIYCYLDVESLRDLPKKFKFECRPGAIIISNGLPIPTFTEKRSIEIPDQKGKFDFLSTKKKFLSSKKKEGKRGNLVYVYEI